MSAPILTTKLCLPPLCPNLVPRPRLVERLNAGLWGTEGFLRRLTVISAPAGYGKTTLAVEWLHASRLSIAWLSLDGNDNDPARFLTYLVAALSQNDDRIGAALPGLLQAAPPPPPEAILTVLVNEIAGAGGPFILALDDYHLIANHAVHQQLNFLLEYLPANLHLVFITREDPPLPLVRLRASGRMLEVRQADLKFTPAEADEFLRRMAGAELAAEDTRALAQRTEGWAVGLHLAGLSLRGTSDPRAFVESFTGSNRYILDYLFEEVLNKQAPEVQDFLLKTSILERLCAPLCAAVSGRSDSFRLLEELEHANLFIERLDPSAGWYRYHPLFGDLLRHRLRLAAEPGEAALRSQASRWFEQNGFPDEAIHQALSAGEWGRAGMLIGEASEALLKRGEFATLIGWFKRLPEAVAGSDPGLCLVYAWALLLASQPDPASAWLERAEALSAGNPALQGEVAAAQAYHAQVSGDGARLVEQSERALKLLPESNQTGRGLVALNLGIATWHSGRLEQAEAAFQIALPVARATGNAYGVATALIFQARCQAVRGQLRLAAENYRQILATSPSASMLAIAHLDLAVLAYEWDDLESAGEHIRQGLEAGRNSGNAEILVAGLVLQAYLLQAQGNPAAASAAARQALQTGSNSPALQRAETRLAAIQVELALAQGDLEGAARWFHDLPDDVDVHPFYRFLGLTRARLLIAQGRRLEAARVLQAALERAEQAGWGYGAIAVRVLQVLAAETPAESYGFLVEALHRAQPEGYLRTFADAGAALIPWLEQAAQRGVSAGYVGQILGILRRAGKPAPAGPLPEPLSERELEVLRLVAAGLSNREIAAQLVVSPGTAKTHIHNICGKLGVRNRTEAATRAKELKLV